MRKFWLNVGGLKLTLRKILRCGEHTDVILREYGRESFTELGRDAMLQAREDLLVKADEFERMALSAPSEVLRCRYISMARYWAILAEESADFTLACRTIAADSVSRAA